MSLHLPAPPRWLAMKSTHLERAEARSRGTGKSGALLWVRVCGWWGCRGSLGLSEPHLPPLQEPLRRCRAPPGLGTTSLLLGVGLGAAS